MRLALVLVGAIAVIAVAGIAGLRSRDDDDARTVILVDERSGSLRGIRFGDDLATVRARLGEPSDDEQGFFPPGTDYTGPPSIPNPRSDPNVRPTPVHYDDTVYAVLPNAGVYAMATLADGARTRTGVGVGDELALVRQRYERVRCGESVAGEAITGETPMYPWCQATVADVGVFFGEDPIESITLVRR